MSDPSNDPGQSDASHEVESNKAKPPAAETVSFAKTCSILSYVVGFPTVAISGLCVMFFFPSIIVAGPCFLIGGLFLISGLVLSKASDPTAFIPLIVALAAAVAFIVWLNLPHGGA